MWKKLTVKIGWQEDGLFFMIFKKNGGDQMTHITAVPVQLGHGLYGSYEALKNT